MNKVRNMPPAMSMLDIVRGANRRCNNTRPCMIDCEYYDFCGALKTAYYEVLRACDHNKQLKSFITHAMNVDAVKKEKEYIDNSKFAHLYTYEESVYGEMKKKHQERHVGHWISKCEKYYDGVTCSVCGKLLPHSDEYRYITDYCPECGARMEAENDL